MSLYSYVNTMEMLEIKWKGIKLSLVEKYCCFFGLLRITCRADSVQSPIVSFTQYCLLASHNLLKEGRNVKQV